MLTVVCLCFVLFRWSLAFRLTNTVHETSASDLSVRVDRCGHEGHLRPHQQLRVVLLAGTYTINSPLVKGKKADSRHGGGTRIFTSAGRPPGRVPAVRPESSR